MAATYDLVELFLQYEANNKKIDDKELFDKIEASLKYTKNYKIVNSLLITRWLNICAENKLLLCSILLLNFFAKFKNEFEKAYPIKLFYFLLSQDDLSHLINLLSIVKNVNNKLCMSYFGLDIDEKTSRIIFTNKQFVNLILTNGFLALINKLLCSYVEFNKLDKLKKIVNKYKINIDDLNMDMVFKYTLEKYFNSG